jgi:hypothetical protein
MTLAELPWLAQACAENTRAECEIPVGDFDRAEHALFVGTRCHSR